MNPGTSRSAEAHRDQPAGSPIAGRYEVVEPVTTAEPATTVEAEPMADVLRAGPLAGADALHVARQLADALAHAHERGVVHGAVAPDAIRIVRGVPPRALLAGFASAAVAPDASVPAALLPYTAPERLRGQPADASTDVFALGMVLFELFEGRPFLSGTEAELRDLLLGGKTPFLPQFSRIVPTGVSALVARAVRRVPGDRQPSMSRLRADLDDCLRRLGYKPAGTPVTVPAKPRAVLFVDDTLAEPDVEDDAAPAGEDVDAGLDAVVPPVRGRSAAAAGAAARVVRAPSFPAHVLVGGGRRRGAKVPAKGLVAALLLLALGWPLWRAAWTVPAAVERSAVPRAAVPAPAADPVSSPTIDLPEPEVMPAPASAPVAAQPPAVEAPAPAVVDDAPVPATVVDEAPAPAAVVDDAPTPLQTAAAAPTRAPRVVARRPARAAVDVMEGLALDFSVRVADADEGLTYVWFLDGHAVGAGAGWRFVPPPAATGTTHTVAVEVTRSGLKAPRVSWKVEVTPHITAVDVHDWLARLAAAWERKDVATLRLYGVIGGDAEAVSVRNRLGRHDGYRVVISNATIRLDGRYATVAFDRADVDGRGHLLASGRESYQLEKQPSGFVAVHAR